MTTVARTALFWVLLAGEAFAHPNHDEGPPRPRPVPTTPAPAPASAPATVVPETYAGVVQALRDGLLAAEKARVESKIVDLRKSCATMRDLAVAAPEKASGLAAEARATVLTTATHLQEQLVLLSTSVEKADATGADAATTAIRADIDALAGLVE